MKLCRFDNDRLGVVLGDDVADVSSAVGQLPVAHWPLPFGDPLFGHLDVLRPELERLSRTGTRKPLSQVKLKSPVATPSKLMAAPVNYRAHQAEAIADVGLNFGADIKTIEHYGMFLKSPSGLVGPSEGVSLPAADRRMDHEIELAVVIGKSGFEIPRAKARAYIAGYTIGLDMTIRGQEDRSWRKSFDSFAVLGPWFVTADEIPDPNALDFWLKVNGAMRQSSNTRALIFDVDRLIEYASGAYALHPGDVIMTGTPEGVGPVVPGDVMDCYIERIGHMTVPVRLRPAAAR
jgi:2-keto-4-pentenoate hydratase/2-oxohepta-3-ene-1,7-dioic acid hydratase in catechol pathway